MSSLPNATPNPPTKGSTPAPVEKPASPMQKEVKSPLVATSPLISGKETPKENSSVPIRTNGASTPSGHLSERTDKDKQRRKEKKEKRDREYPEREAKESEKEKEHTEDKTDVGTPAPESQLLPVQSRKATPIPEDVPTAPTPDGLDSGLKSPTTDSAGTRTPTSRRPQRHPWTLFIRLSATVTEEELRDFFGGQQAGVCASLDSFLTKVIEPKNRLHALTSLITLKLVER